MSRGDERRKRGEKRRANDKIGKKEQIGENRKEQDMR